jgi:hypothetical protein
MTPTPWMQSDYAIGLDFLAENEEPTLLDTGSGVTVIPPIGLPLYGLSLYSIFTLAPIPIFILSVAYFLVAFLFSGHGTPATLAMVIGGCIFMLWGLGKALQLLLSTRDLFPRKFFTTLGKEGIAMHYSRWHFPFQPRTAIAWKDIASTRITKTLFLPGLLVGIPRTWVVEVTAKNGERLKIPFHAKKKPAQAIIEAIGKQIQSQSGTSL